MDALVLYLLPYARQACRRQQARAATEQRMHPIAQ
jgi:hypothetical protein